MDPQQGQPEGGSPMDAAGAERLRWRIEQQQHWRQAPAVLDGRQPPTDPDLEELEKVDDGIRLYASRNTRDGVMRVCKRLVGGVWEHGTVDESAATEPASVGAGSMARVA
jgi:hypothetical protein